MKKAIKLDHNKIAWVDAEDYPRVIRFRWYAQFVKGQWRTIARQSIKGKVKTYRLPRMVMNVSDPAIKVVPLNHDPLGLPQA